jgi:glutamyl-tRNA synthetase
MKNSLSLDEGTVKKFLEDGVPYVIRLKVPENETIVVHDLIRGEVKVVSDEIDDKVLMKSDGMPTYHLANVVDDHLMKISHVIRGEEWLPSAPLHVLLYRYLGWEDSIPAFAHLPLLLKPDGTGKLSKRDGMKGGFPVFPLSWKDPNSGEELKGFRESGYLPEAFVNFLALLGWNPGDEKEIFSMEELIDAFSLERIGKAGARFDIEKANWFNQQYLKKMDPILLGNFLSINLKSEGITVENEKIEAVSLAMRERITFPSDIWSQGNFFFIAPQEYDDKIVQKKWTSEIVAILRSYSGELNKISALTSDEARGTLEGIIELHNTGMGKVMQPLRMVLTGQAGGPDLMKIMEILGAKESSERINNAIDRLDARVKGN